VNFGDTDAEFRDRIVYSHVAESLELHANGARLTKGGVWTNASSKLYKEHIKELSYEAARDAVMALQPVTFKYKAQENEDYVGFIAEDVPDLVATSDRKGLSPMDIVAVLTKVVQEQQRVIAALEQRVNELKNK
jgi:hypothetical protein